MKLTRVFAWMIFDSRGVPSICAQITAGKYSAHAMVPSGASTGQFEAVELRDQMEAFSGRGVSQAIKNINDIIAPKLIGQQIKPIEIDRILIDLDSTREKSKLGANALLAVSMASWRLAAVINNVDLCEYFDKPKEKKFPVPMVNIVNGGVHATNNLFIQEFMIVPDGYNSFSDALSAAVEVQMRLKSYLSSRNLPLLVGDEGGFSIDFSRAENVIELLLEMISQAGQSGKIHIALDCAANEFYDDKNGYKAGVCGEWVSPSDWVQTLSRWINQYELISVEDPFADTDEQSWEQLTRDVGHQTMIVGDDLFVTQRSRLKMGMDLGLANAILIKPNQIGTVLETIECIALAKEKEWPFIISHRSGDTEDSWIADFAVGMAAPFIKTGAVCRSERVSKYNRLLTIEALSQVDASISD